MRIAPAAFWLSPPRDRNKTPISDEAGGLGTDRGFCAPIVLGGVSGARIGKAVPDSTRRGLVGCAVRGTTRITQRRARLGKRKPGIMKATGGSASEVKGGQGIEFYRDDRLGHRAPASPEISGATRLMPPRRFGM